MSNGPGNTNEFEDCVAISEWDVLPRATYMSPRGVAPFSAETTVTLPVFSDMLYFVTRGPFTKGAIRFSSGGTSDSVNIKTTFYYYSATMIEYAKVCILQRDEVNNGIGILTSTPTGTSAEATACFSVHVEFPEIVDDLPAQIDGLLAIVPMFTITLEDSMDFVTFRSITLQTAYSPINVKSLVAETAEVTTSNSTIDGDFTCTESLDLRTSNGKVNASVTLTSSDSSRPAQLSITCSNSPVSAQISLISTLQDGTGGAYKVNTKTTYAALRAAFTTAPLDSVLQFEGSTSDAPASLDLHHSYEGDVYLSTGGARAPQVEERAVVDPAGRGRRRAIRLIPSQAGQGSWEGNVRWGSDVQRPFGSVEVSTSSSLVHLVL